MKPPKNINKLKDRKESVNNENRIQIPIFLILNLVSTFYLQIATIFSEKKFRRWLVKFMI
jgi:hypothetical protein